VRKEYELEENDFRTRELQVRNTFDTLLTVRDVRHILGCSTDVVLDLIKRGVLVAYHLDGVVVEKERVEEARYGLRITPSSLSTYLKNIRVK
jgi:hypothetical protein